MTFDPIQAFIRHQGCDVAMVAEPAARRGWYVCPACGSEFEGPQSSGETGTTRRSSAPRGKLLAAVAALFVAVSVDASAQSQVFADDGEGNQPVGWSGAGCTTVTRAADGGAPKFGVGMIQCNLGVQELALNSWAYGSEFLVRYWFRYDANVDHKAGSKQMRIGFQSPFEIIAACQFENGNAATLFVSVNNRASFWGNRTAPCGDRQWHKLEIARRDNGPLKMWVDDQPVTGTPADWANAGGHVGALYIPSNWSQNPGWEHDSLNLLYIDGVRIYSDQGNTVSGTIMDGTVGESSVPPPPPSAVDCAGTWGSWTRNADSDSACSATGTRTFTESRLFTVSRTPANGGAACPASPETRTVTENCAPPVQSVTYTCWVTSSPAGYADGDVRRYMRCDTNGPVASLPNGTTFTVTVPKK